MKTRQTLKRIQRLIPALAAYFTLATAFAAAQRPGSVDLSFKDPQITTPLLPPDGSSPVEDVVLLPDGRFYIGGHIKSVQGIPRDAIARLLPDGSLDATFQEHLPQFSLSGDTHRIWALLDGKLIAGYRAQWRFNSDGSGDPSWKRAFNVLAVLPEGKLLTMGNSSFGKPRRLNADETPDPNFTSAVEVDGETAHVLVEPDGKLVLFAGIARTSLVRLNADGSLDPTFQAWPSELVMVITRQVDGRYLVAEGIWSNKTGPLLIRLNHDGTLDPSFSLPPDLFLSPLENDHDFILDIIRCVAVQPDGKILVGGHFGNPRSRSQGGLLRLHANGSLDASFDIGAGAVRDWGESVYAGQVTRIVVQPDGQIIAGGHFARFDGVLRANLVRLNGDGRALRLQNLLRQPDGSAQINVTAPANTTFVLEAASSLSPPNWQPLSTNTITASPLTVTDPNAARFPQRFYRAVSR